MAEFDQLPSPKDWKGKKFLDNKTGGILQSDGIKWIPMERPQGPSIAQQMLRGGISAGAQALPLLIPGAGPGMVLAKMGAEVGAPMIAETAMQKTGLAPESGMDVAAAGLTPLLTRGVLGLPAFLRGTGRAGIEFALPQQARKTAVEMVQKEFGGPKSQALFEIARRQGPVATTRVATALQTAIDKESGMATRNLSALRVLKDFRSKLHEPGRIENVSGQFSSFTREVPGGLRTGMAYDDLIDELQRLRQTAESHFKRGNNVTGVAINKARAQILNAMDDISPAIKSANAAYRQEQAIKQISIELRKQNAGTSLLNMFENDPLVAGAFSVKARTQIQDFADRISRAGTGVTMGAGNRFIQAFAEPVAEAMQEERGRALLDILMRNPRDKMWVNRWGAVILAQFGRGAFKPDLGINDLINQLGAKTQEKKK